MMNCCPQARRICLVVVGMLLSGGFVLSITRQSAANKDEKLLRHVVMFEFKETSSEEDVAKVVEGFRQLPSKIPQIADFEYGTDNSPEGLADGFTHCFLVTFNSEKDRDAYLPHEAHQAFVKVLMPHLEKVLVLDYWTAK